MQSSSSSQRQPACPGRPLICALAAVAAAANFKATASQALSFLSGGCSSSPLAWSTDCAASFSKLLSLHWRGRALKPSKTLSLSLARPFWLAGRPASTSIVQLQLELDGRPTVGRVLMFAKKAAVAALHAIQCSSGRTNQPAAASAKLCHIKLSASLPADRAARQYCLLFVLIWLLRPPAREQARPPAAGRPTHARPAR